MRGAARLAGAALALGVTLASARALACGVSGPDGVWSCSLEEHDEALRPRWHLGVAGGYTATTLSFNHGLRGDEQRSAALASLVYAPTPRVAFQGSAGATLFGRLSTPSGQYDFDAGPSAALGASWRAIEGRPFLAFTSVLSFSAATTRASSGAHNSAGYEAFDLRLGAAFGTTLFDALSPYLVARIFGGPILWRYQGSAVTGTDVNHYQLGGGLAWRIRASIDLFAEGVPLGEQALSGGVAFAL
jgi:hypothetical protein